jgi:hypothetical protein
MLRFGVDLAHYIAGGFGARHGFDGRNGADLYNYLVHGHKNSGGAYGGYFTALSYTLRTPPSYPPAWQSQKKFALDLLSIADGDDYGERCKIILKLQPLNAFDGTFYGMVLDLLKTLGPKQNHPSLIGFAIRGLSPGIYIGSGACGGGLEGPEYIPSIKVYPNMPYDETTYFTKWNPLKNIINAYGYSFGWSAGAHPLELYVPEKTIFDSGDFYVNAVSPSRDPDPVKGPQKTYTAYYEGVRNPPTRKSIGCVGGMWENAWFIPNTSPYYITKEKFEMAFKGFSDAAPLNPQGAQILMFYGMPAMTDDDENFYNTYGHCPYMDWWLELCNKYGFMTDYTPSPSPQPITPVTPPPITYPPYPTGVEMTLEGDPSLPPPEPSQTPPQYADANYTYRLFGHLVNLADGSPIPNKKVDIYVWDWETCSWKLLISLTTDSKGYYKSPEIPSPPLPPTQMHQMWYYPKVEADQMYMESEGVREDLPILPLETVLLTVDSTPIKVQCKIDGQKLQTPKQIYISKGTHTIEVPSEVEA